MEEADGEFRDGLDADQDVDPAGIRSLEYHNIHDHAQDSRNDCQPIEEEEWGGLPASLLHDYLPKVGKDEQCSEARDQDEEPVFTNEYPVLSWSEFRL